jgi:MerR family Zn(II)-responsive transcriptional regulator of zntA
MKYLRKQIARRAGIHIETLRYYEKNGLLPAPERNENGYRLYDDETIMRLTLIKRAKACGLTLNEIREVIEIFTASDIDYDYVTESIDRKVKEIDGRISELNGMRGLLNKIKSNIENHVECPVKIVFQEN